MESAARRALPPRLTLTFDNGPDPVTTPRVLADLAARDLKAVFFPVGQRLEDQAARELAAEAAAAGHRVGNHTYSHPRPFGALSPEKAIREIERTDALLAAAADPDRLFRPSAGGGVLRPGVLNRAAVDHLMATGRSLVLWTCVCEDWARPDGSWIALAEAGMAANAWTNLVLHDVPTGAMDHLPRFLDAVLEAGVEVTADLPPATTPIWRGELLASVEGLLAPD